MSPPRHKTHLLPVEIFSEIFQCTLQADPRSRAELMLVCRLWHDIMLSTPGIHSQLRIHKATEKKDVERFGRMWLLDVTVDMENERYGGSFDPERFFVSFMAAAQAASRWRSLELVALPPPGEYKDLQIVLPLQHLETFKVTPSCNLGSFLEPLITAITTTVTSRLTVMEVLHSDAAPCLLQPAHFHIFSSLTTLRLICRRMQNPVDILPYLHRLEIFEAHHLFLPIYSPSVDLPMIQTLHVLRLKSVSVQWIADKVFPVLEECSIIFPHRADAIQSVYMPSCSILKYDSNNLGALEHFRLPTLARLEVKCGQWRTWSGTLQLAALCPIFASQSLTILHLQIKCHERLLVHMLELVPALEELWMGLSSPHALSSTFFLAFAGGGCDATAEIGTSSRTIPLLGRELKRLHLHYKRWLRGPERNALMPVFGDIVVSRQRLKQTCFSMRLSFDEGSKEQVWEVRGLAENFSLEMIGWNEISIGFSNPHGIVFLSTPLRFDRAYIQHFRELEYIASKGYYDPIDIDCFLPFHSLKVVRIPNLPLKLGPNTPSSASFPFFHTLKVLDVFSIPSSFLAGRTFHKLERYGTGRDAITSITGLLTEMPVCTRVHVGLSSLASFKLPRICELHIFTNRCKEPVSVWEKHVAINSNLSGLKFLYFEFSHSWRREAPIFHILRSMPALETLVVNDSYMNLLPLNLFKELVPIWAQDTTSLHQSHGEGQMSEVFCPKLEGLHILGYGLTRESHLIPVLKDFVSLRTTIGSPLKSFTFYHVPHLQRAKAKLTILSWELIGKDGMFVMEEVVPAQKSNLEI